jgi:type 1 glutamine amidotransferase
MKFLLPLLTLLFTLPAVAAPIPVLIVDGQNNHDWKTTTPMLTAILEEGGLCKVEVATSPEKGADLAAFAPDFAPFKVVLSNYNGALWGDRMRDAFEKYVSSGGGFVAVHAANNAFPEWKAYNEMIGLGGWGGRTEKSGPYLRIVAGKWTGDMTPGKGGSHGKQHEFLITARARAHPIMAGLPAKWMHAKDELYDRLRGPAQQVTVLASAFSDPATGGTGLDEPMLMTIAYGQGRVFHTALGHGPEAVKCAGFAVTLQRGTEWAATGKVTQKVPADFPNAEKGTARP